MRVRGRGRHREGVVAWSWLGGASLGTTLLRVIICAVIIQAGYFVLVYAMIARSAPTPADRLREAERQLNSSNVTEGEKLTVHDGDSKFLNLTTIRTVVAAEQKP